MSLRMELMKQSLSDLPQAILFVLFLGAIICGVDLLAWLAAHPHAIQVAWH
jgi:hypothetical protein